MGVCLLLLTCPVIFGQNEFKPKDYVIDKTYKIDSMEIHLLHLRTQSSDEDSMSFSMYFSKYFSIENDTLYAKLPRNYNFYAVDDMLSGRRMTFEKKVISVREYVSDSNYVSSWFYGNTLLGKKVAICPSKKFRHISLSM